jgi:hypothetical protein
MALKLQRVSLYLTLALSLMFSITIASAAEQNPCAEIISLIGDVEIKPAKEGNFRKAELRAKLYVRDTIRTKEKSRARLFFKDESILILGANAQVEISEFRLEAGSRQGLLSLLDGSMRFIVHKFYGAAEPDFKIGTDTAILGIRGTDGAVEKRSPTIVYVYLLEAAKPLQVISKSTGQSIDLLPNYMVRVEQGKGLTQVQMPPAIMKQLRETFEAAGVLFPKRMEERYWSPRRELPYNNIYQPPLPTIHHNFTVH